MAFKSQNEIRKYILKKRAQLSFHSVLIQSRSIGRKLIHHKHFKTWKNIAIYLAINNEVNLELFTIISWLHRKKIYSSRVHPKQRLSFHHYDPNTLLILNRYKIPEPPDTTPCIQATELDLMIVPVIAFDATLHRIGMERGTMIASYNLKKQIPITNPISSV